MSRPHYTIKNRFQKRTEKYKDILTRDILRDVSQRVCGRTDYTVEFDDNGYNIGRLATLEYEGEVNYISFSEKEIEARNSSFQSFPSALVRYYEDPSFNKRLFFYFLPSTGNIETEYFIFMYRLMKTAGTFFLNEQERLGRILPPFNSVEDIITQRNSNRGRNRSNNSTYLTSDENGVLQIFGKTYGANKYETTLLCVAISKLVTDRIELYEIQEGGLTQLPVPAREVIRLTGKIDFITSDITFERKAFEENDSLRSPTFIYNLLQKWGAKKCAFCNCEIPELIQGAHIWPVASIRRTRNLNQDRKLEEAIHQDNGIWLCGNHHKLFDTNLLLLAMDGRVNCRSNIKKSDEAYIGVITVNKRLGGSTLTGNFLNYLQRRNRSLDASLYTMIR